MFTVSQKELHGNSCSDTYKLLCWSSRGCLATVAWILMHYRLVVHILYHYELLSNSNYCFDTYDLIASEQHKFHSNRGLVAVDRSVA